MFRSTIKYTTIILFHTLRNSRLMVYISRLLFYMVYYYFRIKFDLYICITSAPRFIIFIDYRITFEFSHHNPYKYKFHLLIALTTAHSKTDPRISHFKWTFKLEQIYALYSIILPCRIVRICRLRRFDAPDRADFDGMSNVLWLVLVREKTVLFVCFLFKFTKIYDIFEK